MAPMSKAEFYQRYICGEFGNRPRIWESLNDLLDSDYHGLVSIRSLTPGGKCVYRMPVSELKNCNAAEYPQGKVIFQESLPDDLLLIQGTLSRDELGILLEYSTEKNKKFREATFQTARGLRAHHLLRSRLDASSRADLVALLDTFETCNIEFAAYEIDVGVIPHRRGVVFEVRAY